MKKSNFEILESGRQIGTTFSFNQGGETIWSSVGIQKWKGFYKVYIDEILESKMDSEEYSKEIIRSFSDLEEAILFLEANSKVTFNGLKTLKGQRVFNPSFDQ